MKRDDEKLLNILLFLKDRCAAAEDKIRESLGLTAAEYKGLMGLQMGEKISCQELSSRMNLSVSRGSRVIENLFQKGFISRADCTSDRRSKNIWLTKKGMRLRQKINGLTQDCEDRLIADIPETRLNRFKADLKTLIQNF
ncbi:MAG: MarR family transcriptional regulator [Candidatus Aminicenantes bacterium]|jgi:DNA-binding MarR family transcriptional regulator